MSNSQIKHFRVSIDKPFIAENSGFTHIATSYQISKLPDFTKTEYIVSESLEDRLNLLSLRIAVDITNEQNLYVRTKYHYSNGSVSKWSRTIPVKGDQIGIKLSNTVVCTPTLNYELNYLDKDIGDLVINTNSMRLFAGSGNHYATSYEVSTIDGEVIYSRQMDTDNLTSINLDIKTLEVNKAYLLKAKHHTDTNQSSNYGKALLNIKTDESSLFDVFMYHDLVPERWLYLELQLFTNKFSTVDVIISDEYGNIVARNELQTTKTPRIYTGALKPFYTYSVKVRIKLLNGEYTSYKTVRKGLIRENTLIDFDYNLKYLDKFNFSQELLLGGLNIQSSHEVYTGTVLLAKNYDTGVYRYIMNDSRLNEVDKVIDLVDFEDPYNIAHINIVPLYSGRILINYAADNLDGKFRKSYFKLFEYNTITHKFWEINSIINETERYSTGVSGSVAVANKDFVYYIPHMEVDNNNALIDLKMKKISLSNFEIEETIELPISVKTNVSLLALDTDRLLLIGGSSTVIQREFHIESYNRENNSLWVYSIKDNIWTRLATFPDSVPREIYNFQCYLRRDGKVVMFNAVETGPMLGTQRTVLFNPSTLTFTFDNNDYADDMAYNTSVVLRNGDILRITNRELDPQKMFTYVSNTVKDENLVDNDIIDVVTDLVVPAGKLVTIESPYRYNTITIKGTTYEDSGILHWMDGDTVRVFKFRDLLVTRSRIDEFNLFEESVTWDTVTILEDVEYDIDNYIHIPYNETLVLQSPVTVSEIKIEENSELYIKC